ncbi:hypothetical protein LOAG_11039 [Loa loa]|uniref:Uncharacterized protein n=1 Tax=Loa loa TaxID=7209 RepID=A0A1S0TP91_LOALO|nr:hypothetical protein LOAG_11039 [Loa loa]EFO17460.1 hypothetical protein LOAG_11039 [Loa loa]
MLQMISQMHQAQYNTYTTTTHSGRWLMIIYNTLMMRLVYWGKKRLSSGKYQQINVSEKLAAFVIFDEKRSNSKKKEKNKTLTARIVCQGTDAQRFRPVFAAEAAGRRVAALSCSGDATETTSLKLMQCNWYYSSSNQFRKG